METRSSLRDGETVGSRPVGLGLRRSAGKVPAVELHSIRVCGPVAASHIFSASALPLPAQLLPARYQQHSGLERLGLLQNTMGGMPSGAQPSGVAQALVTSLQMERQANVAPPWMPSDIYGASHLERATMQGRIDTRTVQSIHSKPLPPHPKTAAQPPAPKPVLLESAATKLESLATIACALSEQASVACPSTYTVVAGEGPCVESLRTCATSAFHPSFKNNSCFHRPEDSGCVTPFASVGAASQRHNPTHGRKKKRHLLIRKKEKRAYRHEGFPEKLYRLLTELEADGLEHVASFTADGKAVQVHQDAEFEKVLPRYFRHSKVSSFERQLLLYGFIRIKRGPNRGAFEHELFFRGCVGQLKDIQRVDY